MSAYEITAQWALFFETSIYTFGTSVGVLVSNYLGKQKIKDAKQIGAVGLKFINIIPLIAIMLFTSSGHSLSSLFLKKNSEADTITKLASEFMTVYSIGMLPDALRNIATSCLSALSKSHINMIVCLLVICALTVPTFYVLSSEFHVSPTYLIMTRGISMAVAAALIIPQWKKQPYGGRIYPAASNQTSTHPPLAATTIEVKSQPQTSQLTVDTLFFAYTEKPLETKGGCNHYPEIETVKHEKPWAQSTMH